MTYDLIACALATKTKCVHIATYGILHDNVQSYWRGLASSKVQTPGSSYASRTYMFMSLICIMSCLHGFGLFDFGSGCDGVPNSGLLNDTCGVCGGDTSSCAGRASSCVVGVSVIVLLVTCCW
jgi:hypothetical protein